MMLGTCYVAGRMNGEPEHGLPAFHKADVQLTSEGWRVLSPAKDVPQVWVDDIEANGIECESYKFAMRRDIAMVLEADVLFMLPNWLRSNGAKHEALIAHMVGTPCFAYDTRQRLEVPKLLQIQLTGHGAKEMVRGTMSLREDSVAISTVTHHAV